MKNLFKDFFLQHSEYHCFNIWHQIRVYKIIKTSIMRKSILALLISVSFYFPVFSQSPTTNPYCVDLDNTNDYLSVPHNSLLNINGSFTISFWVYPRKVTSYTPLIRKGQGTSPFTPANYAIDLGSSGKLRFFVYDVGGSAKGILTTGPTLTANTWYHIAGVFDKYAVSDNFKLYVNGELVKTATWTGNLHNNSQPLIFGYNYNSSTNARLDEITLWNTALSQAQIQARMYQVINSDDPQYPNLLGYWRFDEGTGTTTNDASINGLNATLVNGAAWTNQVAPVAYTEHALYFDGVDDYVDFASPSSLNITSAITLEAWIKVRSFGNNEAIIDKLKDNSPQGGYNLSVMSSKKVSFKMILGSGSFTLLSSTTLDTGVWYLISATYDGSVAKIYLNGVLDNSASDSSSIVSNTEKIYVGYDDYDTSRHFHGYIAEVKIWNTALTASEISDRIGIWINETDSKWSFLQAYWRFDTGKGIKAYDGGKNENTGTLINNPLWEQVTISVDLEWLGNTMEFHNASNWSPAMVPSLVTNCIIPARNFDPYVSVNSTCKNLTIQADAALVINPNINLTVKGNLTINSGTSYTGYLVVYGTLAVHGTSYFKRYITANGWHYISSPVNNANSNTFYGGSLYYYNEPTSSWVKVGSNTIMANFRGYDVYFKNTNKTITFEGTFNSGNFSTSITKVTDGFNFIGNPYPATIDWDATQGWTKINVNNAIYIWDASISNYCEYVNGVNNNCVGRYIPPTMAFWIQCNNTGGGTIGISPSVQVNAAATFRDDNKKYENEYFKLKVTSNVYSDETSIILDSRSTTDFDGQYDAKKIMNPISNMPDIYTLSTDNHEISINSVPFNQNITLPLFLKIGISGTTIIHADMSELSSDKHIILEDLFLNKTHDFRTGDYQFEGNVGDNPERFKIHILQDQNINHNTTVIEENKSVEPLVYAHQSSIYVNTAENSYQLTIYDINGRKISSINNISGFNVIPVKLSSGIYFVNLKNETNNYSKKVIIK